ncbi:DinB superfamily protein [Ekhidna lutea]|uniref:DinB superfamily protein n=1 Tax=Ekhidna lutea TaxID=447679 RepID=A0A239L6H6_EKHLU|nr:DinB family protein [Ekhidna lutea]SNT25935.1 DinB superfamily protein [Ekhidna lutea]
MVDIQKVPEFYRGYIETLGGGELVPLLLKTGDEFISYCNRITEQQGLYRYEDGKWSIKDVILHVTDAERVFAYRALRFARNDSNELSGFEQNDYVPEANADDRTIHNLLTEFTNVRAASVDLFSSFSQEIRERTGMANGVEMSVEAIGYIISGHLKHHLEIIQERYTK